MEMCITAVVKGNNCVVLSFPRLADDESQAVKGTTCCVGFAVLVVIWNVPTGRPLRAWAFPVRVLLAMGNGMDLEKPFLT